MSDNNNNNNDDENCDESVELSRVAGSSLLQPLCKIPQNDECTQDKNDDECTATTTGSFFLSDDDEDDETENLVEYDNGSNILPTRSVRFVLSETKVQVFEYDREERSVMWYTLQEYQDQEQERIQAIRLLQDYAEDSPATTMDGEFSNYPMAEVIANHKHDTTTRGLEQWASPRLWEEYLQGLEMVRQSTVVLANHLQPDAIATTSLRGSDLATMAALERAQKDANYVRENVWGEETRICW